MDYTEYKNWHLECNVNLLLENLRKRGFNAVYRSDIESAKGYVLSLIPLNAVVGVGGSVTVRELNLIDELESRGNKVIHHWIRGLNYEDLYRIRLSELSCDVFLSSCNAITLDGIIVNSDTTGNRVAALAFGPRKVILIVGLNKIVYDLDMAFWRIFNVAAPMNSRRLGLNVPCAKLGYCNYCESMDCPVRVIGVIERKPQSTEYHVIIVGVNLGF
ncbi:MAG: lactate utilization protein [Candidatus Methanomethylicia archaeon]